MNIKKIRYRFIIPISIFLFLIMVIFITYSYFAERRIQKEIFDKRIKALTEMYFITLSKSMWDIDYEYLEKISNSFLYDRDSIEIIIDLNNIKKFEIKKKDANNFKDIIIEKDVTYLDKKIGSIKFIYTTYYIKEIIKKNTLLELFKYLIMYFLLIIIINIVSRKITRDIPNLISYMNNISMNNIILKENKLISSKDEVGEIIENFNKMIKSLNEKDELFNNTFKFSGLGILNLSLDFKILKINETLTRELGYFEKNLLNTDIYSYIHNEDIQFIKEENEKLLKEEVKNITYETRLKKNNGEFFWVSITNSIVLDLDNNHINYKRY